MKQTQKIALSGLLTAFAAAMIIFSNLIPAGLYTFPAAAGIIIYILSFTAARSYAWASFTAVSILSFFLCADKEASLTFILFFGYYPMLKTLIEKIKWKPAAYLVKLAVFNAAAITIYCLLRFLFSLPEDAFEFFGINMPLIFLAVLNIVFLLYDYAISAFMKAYVPKIYNFVTKIMHRF